MKAPQGRPSLPARSAACDEALPATHVRDRGVAERLIREYGWKAYRVLRRLVVLVVGISVLVVGGIMIVTPGPAFVVIPLGLAILSVEFVWARKLLVRLRCYCEQARDCVRKRVSRE